MNKSAFVFNLMAVTSVCTSSVHAHTGDAVGVLHQIEHRIPEIAVVLAVVVLARVIWLKRRPDS